MDVAHVLAHYELHLLRPYRLQLRRELVQLLPILPDDLPMGQSVPGAGGISVSLVVIPGVALPIIIRHGELSVAANLSDMHMIRTGVNNERPGVAFRINRTGNRSVFGDLTATYYPPGGIEGIVVARINKLAVYSPNTTRSVAMALTVPENVSLAPGGRLAVSFRTPPQEGDELIAEGSLKLP